MTQPNPNWWNDATGAGVGNWEAPPPGGLTRNPGTPTLMQILSQWFGGGGGYSPYDAQSAAQGAGSQRDQFPWSMFRQPPPQTPQGPQGPDYVGWGNTGPRTPPGRGDPAYAMWALQHEAGRGNPADEAYYQQEIARAAYRPPNLGVPNMPTAQARVQQPYASRAPFEEWPAWGNPTPPPSVGRGQPGSAWNPGYMQGRPPSWMMPPTAPTVGGGAGAGGGGPASPDWLAQNMWQYSPGGQNPFYGIDPANWGDVQENMGAVLPWAQMYDQRQQVAQQGQQWQSEFDAGNKQWGQEFDRQGQQWNQTFGEGQRQFNVGADQWGQTFNRQGQQWDQNFGENQRQFNVGADQWGRTFGENQRQFNVGADQWGQTFNRQGDQWNQTFQRDEALNKWDQAFKQAQADWGKTQDLEQNRLADQGQAYGAFNRKFGPNVGYM